MIPAINAAGAESMISMSRSTLATLSKLALALYWLALFTATHWPATPKLGTVDVNDKIAHALAYAILAFLIATTWELSVGRLNGRHLGLVWLGVVIYGALDELTQTLVGRDCSFWDWTADGLGAAIGILIFVMLRRLIEKKRFDQNES
jgi:VanZ family protein